MEHPSLDERLVRPGTREEMLRGELIHAVPAHPPHAEQHCRVDYVIEGHVADGYIVATDMLTRAGPRSDFATDTAVRKEGIDPATNTRYLEELAFEVVSTQSMREIIMRAEDLTERGVRRLFAIFVDRSGVGPAEVCEWSKGEHAFVKLSLDDEIQDPTLVRPLPVRALLDPLQADNAIIDALDSKNNPRLRAVEARGLERGLERAIEATSRALGIELTPEHHARMTELDADELERLLVELQASRRWPG